VTPPVPDNPSRGTPTLDFWAETWIGAVALILLSCSFFSIFSQLSLGAWLGAAVALILTGVRLRRAGRPVFSVPRFHGIGWGIPVLLALCLVSLLAGPHCFLDTYSYRLPQMFFWLQEGHPWSVPNVDMRINQMPHVWPFLSAAFFLPLGERALALPNFIGLLFLAALFRRWAARPGDPDAKTDAIALVFLSAPVFLMGASTNDNVVCCCAFLALSYHFADRPEATLRTTALSALAFALACGIKPQYLALAPVWGAWFFFAPSRPWRTLRLKPLLVLLPLLVLCSPVPTLAVNRICWGSFMHPKVVERTNAPTTAVPETRIEESSGETPASPTKTRDGFQGEQSFVTLCSQLFAPPFNPLFGKMNRWVSTGGNPGSRWCRRHRIAFRPLEIPETASLGVFVSVSLLVGLVAALVREKRHFAFVLPVLVLTGLAVALTAGATLGRSFSGFFLLLFPVALPALARLPKRLVSSYAALCLLVGAAIVVTDPSRPLLPLRFLSRKLANRPAAVKQLHGYAHYSERQHAVRGLLDAVPPRTERIGVVIEPNSPFGDLWLLRPEIRVVPFTAVPGSSRRMRESVEWLVVKSSFAGPGGRPSDSELAASGLLAGKTVDYVSFTQKGPEPWHLLHAPASGRKTSVP
jgi:hypothetical protein